jgi:UDP-glucose 4-epimerase
MTKSPPLSGSINKVVVIGHTGFIGSRLLDRIRQEYPQLETRGLSLTGLDLTDEQSVAAIGEHFTIATAVVMCAAIKRQLGDSPDIYLKNTAMMVNFTNLIAKRKVRRIVYLSSAAVYGEDIENLSITENTPLNCRTYYGLSKMTAEWMLDKAAQSQPDLSLSLVRPATIYGPGDLGTAYGPSGFLTAAMAGKSITLWGDGKELREFLYIDDVVTALSRLVLLDQRGPLNIVAGTSYTFAGALDAIASVTGHKTVVESRPRSKDKVDNRFDSTLLRATLPGLEFTPLDAGIRRMYEHAKVAKN